MPTRWVSERKRETYYKQAKLAGYRSRASFKLKQINLRYNVIKPQDAVLDLGAAPGGWLQIALEFVGPDGMIIGVDLQKIHPLEGVNLIKGDVTKPETIENILKITSSFDVVLSDMSPNITGNYSMDHARSIDLAETAFVTAKKLLKKGGNFVVKVFQGDLFPKYLKDVESCFGFTKAHTPKASRKQSSEIYIIGKGYKR